MRYLYFLFFILFSIQVSAQSNSLVLGGITLHGLSNTQGVWEGMPRKLDGKGQAVFTPLIGYRYEKEYIFTVSGLKDCFDHYASTLLIGKEFYRNKTFRLEFSMGIYGREKPYYTMNNGTRWLAQDGMPHIDVGNIQIIPMGFLGIEFFPDSKISPVIMTNGFLSNLSFVIDF